MINNIFSVPVYHELLTNKDAIALEIESVIKNCKLQNDWQPDNDTALTTFVPGKETNIVLSRRMQSIGMAILSNVDRFLEETKQPYKKRTLKIDQSWINTFDQEQLIGLHEHGYQPNTVSGVYYHKAPKDCGRIIFKSPNPFVVSFPHQSAEYFNISNVDPEEGLMVLFPSWLMHKVEPNRSKDQRVSLSFNVSFDYTFYK